MNAPLLEVRDLRTHIDTPDGRITPVDGVNISLRRGETIGIVGESGSGKSTLVRILLGLDRATSGTVTYRGQTIAPGRPRPMRWFRREAQVVLQDPLSSLDPRMTIASVVLARALKDHPRTCLTSLHAHPR